MVLQTKHSDAQTIDAVTVRRKLARQMLDIVEHLAENWGRISCPTYISLLKKELARCYVELEGATSEMGFISIVSLIKASLSGTKWKQYTPERLNLLQKALNMASQTSHITYDDYQTVQKEFWDAEIETAITIDLATLDEADLILLDEEGWDDAEEE